MMSVQDKLEHILKSIHLLFSESPPYGENSEKIIVEKKAVFDLLEKLNLAVYEAMDQYEVTSQKHEMAERRCEKRGEEIVQKASRHADDIYAASIMYTDDAINRICYIMDDASHEVRNIFHKMNAEMEAHRERVRRNQLELTGQLRDFADTDKYVKLIQEVNKQAEQEHRHQVEGKKEKRIPNEGKSYSAVKPEIKINQAYFERTGKSYDFGSEESEHKKEESDSMIRVTGKEFAENLRRRAARNRTKEPEVEDMSEPVSGARSESVMETDVEDILAQAGAGLAALAEAELKELKAAAAEETGGTTESAPAGDLDGESLLPEIHVDLDAEYFKWREEKEGGEQHPQEKKERHFLFGRKS